MGRQSASRVGVLLDSWSTISASEALVSAIYARRPNTRLILLSNRISEPASFAFVQLGVKGFVTLKSLSDELPRAVESVVSGGLWIPRTVLSKFLAYTLASVRAPERARGPSSPYQPARTASARLRDEEPVEQGDQRGTAHLGEHREVPPRATVPEIRRPAPLRPDPANRPADGAGGALGSLIPKFQLPTANFQTERSLAWELDLGNWKLTPSRPGAARTISSRLISPGEYRCRSWLYAANQWCQTVSLRIPRCTAATWSPAYMTESRPANVSVVVSSRRAATFRMHGVLSTSKVPVRSRCAAFHAKSRSSAERSCLWASNRIGAISRDIFLVFWAIDLTRSEPDRAHCWTNPSKPSWRSINGDSTVAWKYGRSASSDVTTFAKSQPARRQERSSTSGDHA